MEVLMRSHAPVPWVIGESIGEGCSTTRQAKKFHASVWITVPHRLFVQSPVPVFLGARAFLGFDQQEGLLQLLFAGRFWPPCGLSGLARHWSNFSEEKTSERF